VELRFKKERLFDEDVYTVHPDDYRALCEQLKQEGYDFPRSVSGIDMGYGLRVTLHLTRMRDLAKVAVRTDVPYENPVVASVTDLWPGVEWYEREAYDMLGIRFRGHPDLRRLLLIPHIFYDRGGSLGKPLLFRYIYMIYNYFFKRVFIKCISFYF